MTPEDLKPEYKSVEKLVFDLLKDPVVRKVVDIFSVKLLETGHIHNKGEGLWRRQRASFVLRQFRDCGNDLFLASGSYKCEFYFESFALFWLEEMKTRP